MSSKEEYLINIGKVQDQWSKIVNENGMTNEQFAQLLLDNWQSTGLKNVTPYMRGRPLSINPLTEAALMAHNTHQDIPHESSHHHSKRPYVRGPDTFDQTWPTKRRFEHLLAIPSVSHQEHEQRSDLNDPNNLSSGFHATLDSNSASGLQHPVTQARESTSKFPEAIKYEPQIQTYLMAEQTSFCNPGSCEHFAVLSMVNKTLQVVQSENLALKRKIADLKSEQMMSVTNNKVYYQMLMEMNKENQDLCSQLQDSKRVVADLQPRLTQVLRSISNVEHTLQQKNKKLEDIAIPSERSFPAPSPVLNPHGKDNNTTRHQNVETRFESISTVVATIRDTNDDEDHVTATPSAHLHPGTTNMTATPNSVLHSGQNETGIVAPSNQEKEAFLVVHFIEDGSVQVVPQFWVSGDHCSWPSNCSPEEAQKLVMNRVIPRHDWASVRTRVLRTADTYKGAMDKLKEGHISADTEGQEKLIRKERTKWPDCEDGSTDENGEWEVEKDLTNPLLPIVCMNDNRRSSNSGLMSSHLATVLSAPFCPQNSPDVVEPDLGLHNLTVPELLRCQIVFQQEVLGMLQNLQGDPPKIMRTARSEVELPVGCNAVNLPVTSVEELQQFEEFLKDKDSYDNMVSVLKTTGGMTIDDTIRRMLRKVLTNSVGMTFSYTGRKGKTSFCSLNLRNLLFDAVQWQYPQISELNFGKTVGDWLRFSKKRSKVVVSNALVVQEDVG